MGLGVYRKCDEADVHMAAGLGFEPRLSGPEPDELPLLHPALPWELVRAPAASAGAITSDLHYSSIHHEIQAIRIPCPHQRTRVVPLDRIRPGQLRGPGAPCKMRYA